MGKHKVEFKYYALLLGCIVVAFLLRVLPQLKIVFVNGNVLFKATDDWYHMRLADSMMINFPFPLRYDMYAAYPSGLDVGFRPLMDWIIAGIGRIGFNYEYVGAFLPPIIGALTLIPIYLLGRELFNKNLALLSCFFCAIVPSEFLHRSLLGATDNHILEVFLMVIVLLLIVVALRSGKLRYFLLAGLTLGLYCLNWHGGAFLFLILVLWFVIQFFIGTKNKNFCFGVSAMFGIAYLISFKFQYTSLLVPLLVVVFVPLVFYYLRNLPRWVLPALAGVGVVLAFLLFPALRVDLRSVFIGFGSTIEEARPLELPNAYAIYGVGLFLMFAGLYLYFKSKINTLFVVWAVVLIIAGFAQKRWGYYMIVPYSFLAAYSIFWMVDKVKKEARTMATVLFVFLTVCTFVKGTVGVARIPNLITNDWYGSLLWMRENTPEPFGSSDAYYSLHSEKPLYGVISWWDYGHWIIRIAHRVPVSSPANQEMKVASLYFTARTVEEANDVIKNLNIKYVILDVGMLAFKWYAVIIKSGENTPLQDSFAYKLWTGEAEGYKLVHKEGDVRIYEKQT